MARRFGAGPIAVLRGLAHRGGTTALILIVALVASAAASTGPAYYASARTSILRDTFARAPLVERGYEVSAQGDLTGAFDPLRSFVDSAVTAHLSSVSDEKRLLAAPIGAVEATTKFDGLGGAPPIVWRTDVCAHLRMTQGRCAKSTSEVVVGVSTAQRSHWHVGQRVHAVGWATFTIVGLYAAPNFALPYWFNRGSIYFPIEDPQSGPKGGDGMPRDALFTPQSTINANTGHPQGTVLVDQLLNTSSVTGGDLGRLNTAIAALMMDNNLTTIGATVQSAFSDAVDDVHASWRSLAVPIFLITIELLLLVWLLMFLVVGDAIAVRGPEIALMKLRGRRGLRLLGFALGEPVALLALALPLGVGVGTLACALLDDALLRPGTAVAVPALAWAAAGVATVGGLFATVVAGRRTVRRTVVDQWQHASREATRRGWVLDAIVVTAAVAGIGELIIGGQVTSVGHSSLGLLVPGLLGLAVAIVASRLLPMSGRALFRTTRRRGGLGAFLAVRHVARRSNGARTTIILATAFGLATFAVAAWATGQSNRQLVADVAVGAPTVLSVDPGNHNLGSVVNRLDPDGGGAVTVDSYFNPSSTGLDLLATDPQRFARVAAWHSRFADRPISALAKTLTPASAKPVPINGDRIRVRLDIQRKPQFQLNINTDLASPGADGKLFVPLGLLSQKVGPQTLTADLPGCPCTLEDLQISLATTNVFGVTLRGQMTLRGVDTLVDGVWKPVPGLNDAARWRPTTNGDPDRTSQLSATSSGLTWPYDFPSTSTAEIAIADRPAALPALTTAGAPGRTVNVTGLDDDALAIKPTAVVRALPGAPNGGVLVDRGYAERASSGVLSGLVTQQVWTTHGSAAHIEDGLRHAGVRIVDTQSATAQADEYNRQGPGLASTVFLADAAAAAILAGVGALMGLVAAARRRRFEYAALRATGASRRSLYVGLLLEQSAVLVVGAVAGIVAGVVAAVIAVRSVPEFVERPLSVRLYYDLQVAPLAIFLGAVVGGLLVVAAIASRVLLAGATPERLRETQE